VELRNSFQFSTFDRLDQAQMDFLLPFLKCRGSLKSLQEEMNISYPTAKKRLEELLIALEIGQEDDCAEQAVVDLSSICVNRNSIRASEIIKAKLLDNGDIAIGIFNLGDHPADPFISLDTLGLNRSTGKAIAMRDLWKHEDIGVYTDIFRTDFIAPHECRMYRAKIVDAK
jgi:hypothetical protein